jgi:hypothetical protein
MRLQDKRQRAEKKRWGWQHQQKQQQQQQQQQHLHAASIAPCASDVRTCCSVCSSCSSSEPQPGSDGGETPGPSGSRQAGDGAAASIIKTENCM